MTEPSKGSGGLSVPGSKAFKNKLQLFPEEIRDKIDQFIQMGRGAISCLKWVKATYKGSLDIPSLNTFESYVRWRKTILAANTDGQIQIQRVMSKQMDLTRVPVGDSRALYEAIKAFMAWRIEEIKAINLHLHNAMWERIITDDVRVLLDTENAMLKLGSKEELNKEKVRAVVAVALRYIGPKIQQAYKLVHGNKHFEDFVREVETEMDKLPYEDIETEALRAFETEDAGE